jgi:hypothetical protein
MERLEAEEEFQIGASLRHWIGAQGKAALSSGQPTPPSRPQQDTVIDLSLRAQRHVGLAVASAQEQPLQEGVRWPDTFYSANYDYKLDYLFREFYQRHGTANARQAAHDLEQFGFGYVLCELIACERDRSIVLLCSRWRCVLAHAQLPNT